MPTPSQMLLPKPKSSEEFEDICTDVLQVVYNRRFQRYGRNGQKQNGIDVIGYSENSKPIVAQCKDYQKKNINFINEVRNDYNEAKEKFCPERYIVMTALDRDRRIIDELRSINSEIEMWFWDEIQQTLCANQMLLQKYYMNINGIPTDVINKICANADILIRGADDFHQKEYNIYQYNEQLYNNCLSMSNAINILWNIRNEYYTQISQLRINDCFEYLINSTPQTYNAKSASEFDAEFIGTISNFTSYFMNEKIANKYKDNCLLIKNSILSIYNS